MVKSKTCGPSSSPKPGDGISVRENKRARKVSIRVRPSSEVLITIPTGFDRSQIPDILAQHSTWIDTQKKRYRIRRPSIISLKAIGERWKVTYIDGPGNRGSIEELPGHTIVVHGTSEDPTGWVSLLNRWLHEKARNVLERWLGQLSADLLISFNKLTVKRQNTKWGSCSRKRNINLNRNLLFLRPEMARYVLIHELCHIKQPNHSEQFWELLDNYVMIRFYIIAK